MSDRKNLPMRLPSFARRMAAVLGILSLSACESSRFSYSTVAEAREAQMFEKGWLPDVLPESAHSIRITTWVDVGRCRGRFDLPESDLAAFLESLTSERVRFRYDAWQEELKEIEDAGRDVLFYRSDRAVFAFDCDVQTRSCGFVCGE
jgi:hypothetical protein